MCSVTALKRASTPSYGDDHRADTIDEFFSQDGPLSQLKEGYRKREEQIRLATRVEKAVGRHETLLADAPTGTGKTLSYLAGPILRDEKLVVSTATIALQHQLLLEELPLLRKALSIHTNGERELTFGLLKGRSNFLCQSRLESAFLSGNLLDRELLEKIHAWSVETTTGDREEISFPLKRPTWLEVAADANDCVRHACKFGEECHYFAQRDAAESVDVLVVNHALLMANVASDYNVFDMEGRHLILDEAHRIEEAMSESFGAHVTHYRVSYTCRSVNKRAPEAVRYTQDLESAADLFFDALRNEKTLTDVPPPHYNRMLASLTALRKVLASNQREEVNKLATMVARLSGDLRSFYTPPSAEAGEADETHARALLPARRTTSGSASYPELKSWLVEMADVFREEIAGRPTGGATVLTSATLATGDSFSYAKKRLGLDNPEAMAGEFLGEEIFDYENNCLLYLEDRLPEPSSSELFTARCIQRSEELVTLSGGRALILLSTHRALSRFKSSFAPPSYPVRFQGEASPTKLAAWLRESDGGILVGTRTLWEGISIEGPCVSLVIVDKVPFPVPDDPVINLLSKKAGKRWFKEVSMPRAQVALRQGSGRLIRTVDDRGVVAVLDTRLHTKSWGKAMVRTSLPAAPITISLKVVSAFFATV